jgi:hypothetical protein
MSTLKLNRGMETLPKGFHVIEKLAPTATEETEKKLASRLVESMVASYSTASVPPADLKVRLHKAAVRLYLAQLSNPSESMDDPVMLLLEKAQSLTP